MDELWDQLQRLASTADNATRCSTRTKDLFEGAFLGMTVDVETMATKCEAALSKGHTKCMGQASNISTTALMRRAYRFQHATRQFTDCPWIHQVAKAHKSANVMMGLGLDRIFHSAPEMATLRQMYPDIDFASFVHNTFKMQPSDAEGAERGIFKAMGESFGRAFPIGVDDSMAGFKGAEPHQLAANPPPMAADHDKDETIDDLVNGLEPEWCYRQWRYFSHNGGCASGGDWGEDSCFSFTAGQNYNSDGHSNKSTPPTHLVERGVEIALNPAEDGQDQAGGYRKSSWNTWGVCLPKKDPKGRLNRLNELRAQILDGRAPEMAHHSDGTTASLVQVQQTLQSQTMVEARIIGLILQLPALILLAALFVIALAVFLPFFLVQMVIMGVSYPLLILGSFGELLRFLVMLPVCLVTGLLRALYNAVTTILWGVYWVGSFLFGMNTWNSTSSNEDTKFNWMCPMFRSVGYAQSTLVPRASADPSTEPSGSGEEEEPSTVVAVTVQTR
jgi:hypothetical protein